MIATQTAATPTPTYQHPTIWMEGILGANLHRKQRDVVRAVRDYPRVTVKGCNSSGKDYVAARIAVWWLNAFPADETTKVVITGPTYQQVKEICFDEIRQAYASALVPAALVGKPAPRDVSVYWKPGCFIRGVATDEPEKLRGTHAAHVLAIVTEAQGYSPDMFNALTTLNPTRMLLLGNTTPKEKAMSSDFYDSFHMKSHLWHQISIAYDDLPDNVPGVMTAEDVAAHAGKYGVDSDWYNAIVNAQWPAMLSARNMIDPITFDAAVSRQCQLIGQPILGVDIARFGSDSTVAYLRCGNVAREVLRLRNADTVEVANHIEQIVRRNSDIKVVIDGVNIGGGVVDLMKAKGFAVTEFTGSMSPDDEVNANLITKAWTDMARWIETADIDANPQLRSDLISRTYDYTIRELKRLDKKESDGDAPISAVTNQRYRILTTLGWKSALQTQLPPNEAEAVAGSPDAGDALAMTFGTTYVTTSSVIDEMDKLLTVAGNNDGW